MMQEFIVAIIVACAAAAVLRRYAPKALKQMARSWSARSAARIGWYALAARIEQQAEAGASCADGCGSCGNCSPDAAADDQATLQAETIITVEALKQTLRQPVQR